MIKMGMKKTQSKIKMVDDGTCLIGNGGKHCINPLHAIGTDTWSKEIRRKCRTALGVDEDDTDNVDVQTMVDKIQAKRRELYQWGVHVSALDFHDEYQDILYPL